MSVNFSFLLYIFQCIIRFCSPRDLEWVIRGIEELDKIPELKHRSKILNGREEMDYWSWEQKGQIKIENITKD
jgi:hypothetical protein